MTDLAKLIDTELRHAWAAGILDGRGRWTILRRRYHSLDPRIEVRAKSQRGKHDPMLVELADMFNGSISVTKRGTTIWQVSGALRCAAVNEAVLPYLSLNGPRARAHQHVCKRIIEYKRESFQQRRISDDEVTQRLELFNAFERIP